MKKTFFCLYILLLTLFTGLSYAEPTGLVGANSKPLLVELTTMEQNNQGRKGPASARQPEQSSAESPVKAVPMTERKSKPQRVEMGGARGGAREGARGPREVRSARGGSDAGRGAQGGGARGAGRGLGRGHGN